MVGNNSGMESCDPSFTPGPQRTAERARQERDTKFQNSHLGVPSVTIGGRDRVPSRDRGPSWVDGCDQSILPFLDPPLHPAAWIGHSRLSLSDFY